MPEVLSRSGLTLREGWTNVYSETVTRNRSTDGGNPRKAVTIAEVARLAEVSPATVSRVLNDDPRVDVAYRQRVLTAVEQLNYRPNRLARNLRKQQTLTIALVVPDITNPHFTEIIRAIEAETYRAGYHLVVCNTDERADKQATYLGMLAQERISGAVISPADPRGPEIGELIDQGIPVVAFDREIDDPRADAVVSDNVEATRIATELLTKAGHHNLFLLSGRLDVSTGAERFRGFEQAAHAAGIELQYVDANFREDTAYEVVLGLGRAHSLPTAFVAANNLMTLGALRALRDQGVAVPHDVAIVGIDDPPWSTLVDPPLTTVGQPVREMAHDAISLLFERIANPALPPRRRVHTVALQLRGSCGTRDANGAAHGAG